MTGNHLYEAARLACEVAIEKKGEDVLLLDIREISAPVDFFILVTRRSQAHGKALAQAIQDALDEFPLPRRGIEGYPNSTWILLDYYSIVAHIFEKEDRDYYSLEHRWSEAKIEKFEGETLSRLE